jgi:phosphohistidine phosphatase
MKDLILMRHAKAVTGSLETGDAGRPLNARGRRAAAVVAQELRRLGAKPDLILCSPARRTRETLDHVLDAFQSLPPACLEPDLYLAEATRLIERFRRMEADVGCALLIGHNDGLAQAANALATTGAPDALASMRTKYPTGAAAWLRFPVDDWQELGRTRGELFAFIRPRDLATAA